MTSKDQIVGTASHHTLQKFDIFEKYIKAWAQKLLNYSNCQKIVFIDCMSNSGEYRDSEGKNVYGTPVRAAKILSDYAYQYPNKEIVLYFNDNSAEKIELLKSIIKFRERSNYHIDFGIGDGNKYLDRICGDFVGRDGTHYLLIYDPFDASICWPSLVHYLNNWGEVIINHMVSDTARAVRVAKSPQAIEKYENTYLASLKSLVECGSDKKLFEERIKDIIKSLRAGRKQCYIASFPFFNSQNTLLYNLLFCSGNIEGLKLYKKTVWQQFEGKSSEKKTHFSSEQQVFDFSGNDIVSYSSDEGCYTVHDIADYVFKAFKGKGEVSLKDIWSMLDEHPIFPSDGFKPQIKKDLAERYGAIVKQSSIVFP